MSKVITLEQAGNYGINLAAKLMDVEQKAQQGMQKTLLQAAVDCTHDEQVMKATLEGFEQYYKDKEIAGVRQRKTEVKAVFDAVSKTLTTNENLDILKGFAGTYQQFLAKARELRGATSNGSSTRASRGKKPGLTDKQFDKVEAAISTALPAQLETIAEESIVKIVGQSNTVKNLPGLQTLRLIRSACLAAEKTENVELAVKKVLGQIFDLANPLITAMEKANQETARMLGKKSRDGAQPAKNDEVAEDVTPVQEALAA